MYIYDDELSDKWHDTYMLQSYINRLFADFKGSNFNIYSWAWFGYFIS